MSTPPALLVLLLFLLAISGVFSVLLRSSPLCGLYGVISTYQPLYEG